MHEVAIAEALVEQVLRVAGENRLRRVAAINLRIGKLQAVVPEALLFALEVILEDTVAAGAAVNIEEVPCRVRCSSCGGEFETDEWSLFCPRCENGAVEVTAGRELIFDSLEGE